MCFLAGKVLCNAPLAIGIYLSFSTPSLSGRLPLNHLSTSTSIFQSSETSCRSAECWAGSIRESNLGLLMHTQPRTDIHKDASQIFTDIHPSSVALWPACLQSHRSASTLPNGFFPSSIFLHFFSLCVTRNNKCSRPRKDVYVSNFSFNFGLTSLLLSFFFFVMFQSCREIDAVFPTHSFTALG